jgi:hypothetical protein
MEKAAFNKKTLYFHQQIGLEFEKERTCSAMLHLEYSLNLLQLETLQKLDKKYLGSFEMLCLRRMEKISWTDYVKNEEVS